MSQSPAPEERLSPLILAARILSCALAPLALACGAVQMNDGHAAMGVLVAAIGVFSSVCLYVLISGLSTLTELATVNRYRAERDEELAKLLTEVHRLLKASGGGTADATQNRSGVFQSSQMPFTPDDDGALTTKRPIQHE